MTRDIINQELAGHDPSAIIDRNTIYTNELDVIDAFTQMSHNELVKSGDLDLDHREAKLEIYARAQFSSIYKAMRHSSQGKFCLFHGDITQHPSNILFDTNLNIVAVIDWEETWVMPLELVCPPTWLSMNLDRMLRDQGYFDILARGFPHCSQTNPQDRNYALGTVLVIAVCQPSMVYDAVWTTLRCTPRLWGSSNTLEEFLEGIDQLQLSAGEETLLSGMAERQLAFWHEEAPSKVRQFHDEALNDRYFSPELATKAASTRRS